MQLADDSGVTSSDFSNGLIGDFDQDGIVGSADLIVFLGNVWYQLSQRRHRARGATVGSIQQQRRHALRLCA